TAPQELRARAEGLASALAALPGVRARAAEDRAFVGGGSLPDQALPSWVGEGTVEGLGDAALAHRPRPGTPGVMGGRRGGKLAAHMRTVFPAEEPALGAAVREAVGVTGGTHESERGAAGGRPDPVHQPGGEPG